MVLERLKNKYGHKKIMLTSSDKTGCGYHRIYSPYLFLRDSFEWCEYNSGFPAGDPRIFEADVIVIQRALHEYFLQWIPAMQAQGKKIIYDLDDTLWDIPSSNLAHRHYPPRELRKVDAVIKLVDCITTSTVPLGDFMHKRFNKPTFIVPNKLWMSELGFDGDKKKNDKIKIGWAGSYTHAGDFDNYLVRVMNDLPFDKVEFYTMGYTPQFFKQKSISIPWVETGNFHKTFCEQNWDIGIMVAADNMFNKCKSNLKFLEYGAIKCAAVGHDIYPYVNTIEHGVDGFLVKNQKTDWAEYIYKLIDDESLRLTIADNAYQKVKTHWTYEGDAENIENKYLEIFDFLGL